VADEDDQQHSRMRQDTWRVWLAVPVVEVRAAEVGCGATRRSSARVRDTSMIARSVAIPVTDQLRGRVKVPLGIGRTNIVAGRVRPRTPD
jgi:hypothetical protein